MILIATASASGTYPFIFRRRVFPGSNEKIVRLRKGGLAGENYKVLASEVAQWIKKGFHVAVDCGIEGIRLQNYALTHFDERVNADRLKGGLITDIVKDLTGTEIQTREEIRKPFLRNHIFIIFEPVR